MTKTCYKLNKSAFYLFALFYFTLTLTAFAQRSGGIKGKVTDLYTKEALVGANVVLKGTSYGSGTDVNGKYVIYNIPAGKYQLEVSYVGYRKTTTSITITEKTQELDYALEPGIEGQTVTITAQASGQLSAINESRSSNTIANVVSKDRIKELPDVNAAESIGRLPGVSIQRSGGEANKVEIRGLDPKYNLVTVNGIALPSTGSTDRSTDLSLVSSNMIDGISLKKAVTPDMDPDVLGGTVDLRLKEAPDSLVVNFSAQGGYNKLQKYYGNYNFNGSVSNRFFDNLLGVIVNLNADNYDRSADKLQANYVESQASGVTSVLLSELSLKEEQVKRKRIGASFLADYLIPNGKITANAFFSQVNSHSLAFTNDMWTPNASYNTNRHFYFLEESRNTTNIYTSALGANQDLNWISYDFTIARSGSDNNTPEDRTWQFSQDAHAFPTAITALTPTTALPGLASIDTNNTQLANAYAYTARVKENHTTTQINFKLPFSLTDQISGYLKTGAKFHWIDRSNNQEQAGENGMNYGNGTSANPELTAIDKAIPEWGIADLASKYGGLPITQFLLSGTRSNFLGGDYPQGFKMNVGMLNRLTDALYNSKTQWLNYSIGSLGHDYSGSENYQAGYVMAEFDITKYITLIPGVRWDGEHTVYTGESYRQITINNQEGPPADLKYITIVRNNSFWLPMVNLLAKPYDWMQVKLSRTQTLARPDYIQYAPITYVTADQSQITAANTSLKTARATNYDAEVSVYENYIGYFSVDGFYKDVKDFVFYANYKLNHGMTPPAGLNIPSSWYQTTTPQIYTYMNNPNHSKYSGIELNWQTRFWYLPSFLQGLVLDINYTHIYSVMDLQYDSLVTKQVDKYTQKSWYVARSIRTRMPNQPANIFNVTLGYDLDGFSLRLSYLHQADKLTGIGYAGIYPSTILSTYTGAYARWDLSVSQKVGDKLQFYLNMNNINERPDKTYTGSALSNPSYFEYYGFMMDLGFRYHL
jgi:TonB-dependent receptor